VNDVRTLNDLYRTALIERPKPNAFRVKQDGAYRDVSSEAFARMAAEIAAGLMTLGLNSRDRVAILAETRLEWAAVDCAILSAGFVSVPIYPTLAAEAIGHILLDSGARAIVASTPEQAEKVESFRTQRGRFPVILMDGEKDGALSLEALRERGRTKGAGTLNPVSVEPEDLATLIYTSGTTGPPKGVMLTHGNIASNAVAALSGFSLQREDTCLSFLPLSHVFERTGGLYCMLLAGATIAYAESMEAMPKNVREVEPTVLLSVPRVYEKVHSRALETARSQGPLSLAAFRWAEGVGRSWSRLLLEGRKPGGWLRFRHALADRLVFRKIRERLGGRIRFMISGGAPLLSDTALFFHAAGLPLLEGYGLTETSPVLAVNSLATFRLGSVGKPLPGVEIQIAEDGEILARGPCVMKGYYNLPEATADAMQGGWFHTGDIGHQDADGFLYVTDRKKDLIVTAGGKKIAPQPIEAALKLDPFISEAVVLGDRRPYLIALLVPHFHTLEAYAKEHSIPYQDRNELVRSPRIQSLLEHRVALHQEHAAPFETIKKIHVLERPLEEGPELTPTLKVKRKEVMRIFEQEIAGLYEG
jgi:long-chain acyl-CoA synthetase